MPTRAWPDEAVTKLRRLAASGLSQNEIADEMSHDFGRPISSSTIAGQCHRRGIKLFSAATRRKVAPKTPDNSRKPKTSRPELPRAKPGAISSGASLVSWTRGPKAAEPAPIPDDPHDITPAQRLTLQQLPFRGRCKWPYGDPQEPGFFFCGARSDNDRGEDAPYCAHHSSIAYTDRRAPVYVPEKML